MTIQTQDSDPFNDWDPAQIKAFFKAAEFPDYRQLESGEWVGVCQLLFTWAVCTGIDYDYPFTYRWCFSSNKDALEFFHALKTVEEVPTNLKTLKGHRFTRRPLLVQDVQGGWHIPNGE